LRSTPNKCLERIKTRGRENEMSLNIDYITSIHNLHEEAYLELIKTHDNVIVIDVDNKSIQEIVQEILANFSDT
jgi:thymidylate kinase